MCPAVLESSGLAVHPEGSVSLYHRAYSTARCSRFLPPTLSCMFIYLSGYMARIQVAKGYSVLALVHVLGRPGAAASASMDRFYLQERRRTHFWKAPCESKCTSSLLHLRVCICRDPFEISNHHPRKENKYITGHEFMLISFSSFLKYMTNRAPPISSLSLSLSLSHTHTHTHSYSLQLCAGGTAATALRISPSLNPEFYLHRHLHLSAHLHHVSIIEQRTTHSLTHSFVHPSFS